MASAENDRSEGGGEGGDWTAWLRSRLERVAAPERRQDPAGGSPRNAGADRTGDDAPPAPRLPPSEQESGPDLDLQLQWPGHPLEPQRRAEGASTEEPEDEAPAAGDEPGAVQQVASQPASGPPAANQQAASSRPDGPGPPADAPLPRIAAPVAGQQTAPPAADAPAPRTLAAPATASPASAEDRRPRPQAPSGRLAPRPFSGLTEPLPAVPAHELVAGLDRLQSAVTSLSARVDGLSDATLAFRSVTNERLDEYTETVLRAAKAGASDVQEYRRMHTAALAEVRRNANDTAETLRRLTGWMEELARVQGDDERWAAALSQAFEEAAAERREGEEQAREVVSTLPERLGRMEQVLDQLAELAVPPVDPAGAGLAERLERIDHTVDRLAQELAAEPPDPLVPVVESLAERLERIEHTVAGLGEALEHRRPAPAVLDDEQLAAIAAAVADRLGPRRPADPADPAEPQSARTSRVPAADAPPAPPRSRRTTPIRAPSRSGPRTGR